MSTAMPELRGIFPIVYTPFDSDGRIDEEDLEHLVEWMIASGTHGLGAVGGASECHKMPVQERKWLAERTINFARGRVPVIVGTSAANTAESVELSRAAEEAGARAVFLTPPTCGTGGLDFLRYHYGAVAKAVKIPVMMQDVGPMTASLMAQICEALPSVCYVKEEAPDTGHRISEMKRLRPELKILSGGGTLITDLMRGAQGAIPGSIAVADYSKAFDLFMAGDVEGARARVEHSNRYRAWSNPAGALGVKEVLRRIGVFKAAHLREPSGGVTMDEQDHRELSIVMERMGPPY